MDVFENIDIFLDPNNRSDMGNSYLKRLRSVIRHSWSNPSYTNVLRNGIERVNSDIAYAHSLLDTLNGLQGSRNENIDARKNGLQEYITNASSYLNFTENPARSRSPTTTRSATPFSMEPKRMQLAERTIRNENHIWL